MLSNNTGQRSASRLCRGNGDFILPDVGDLAGFEHARLEPLHGIFAGVLVATYISVEAPLSGMSMSPARTLGSAIPAHVFSSLSAYFTAPPRGMLLAAQLCLWQKGAMQVLCAKLHHASA